MDTLTKIKSATLRTDKDKEHASDEEESEFYTDQDNSFQQDKYEANELEASDSNSIKTSETESIQRVHSVHDERTTPTTGIIRRETTERIPTHRGIAPIPPIPDRNGPGQTIAKEAGTALSLRLDLNLDIEVELKAKIRGDLTLSLL